jgi:hypothetical protein
MEYAYLPNGFFAILVSSWSLFRFITIYITGRALYTVASYFSLSPYRKMFQIKCVDCDFKSENLKERATWETRHRWENIKTGLKKQGVREYGTGFV